MSVHLLMALIIVARWSSGSIRAESAVAYDEPLLRTEQSRRRGLQKARSIWGRLIPSSSLLTLPDLTLAALLWRDTYGSPIHKLLADYGPRVQAFPNPKPIGDPRWQGAIGGGYLWIAACADRETRDGVADLTGRIPSGPSTGHQSP